MDAYESAFNHDSLELAIRLKLQLKRQDLEQMEYLLLAKELEIAYLRGRLDSNKWEGGFGHGPADGPRPGSGPEDDLDDDPWSPDEGADPVTTPIPSSIDRAFN